MVPTGRRGESPGKEAPIEAEEDCTIAVTTVPANTPQSGSLICKNSRRSAGDEGRWIKVSWGEDISESYSTALEVVCKDRPNLLVDISTVLSASKVNVSSMNVHSTTDGFAIFYITISVTDAAQLEQVMRKLHQISSVMKVNRPAG